MKARILSIVLIAVLAISTTAMAQNDRTNKRSPVQKKTMMKQHRQMPNAHGNFFTEDQQEKLKAIRLESAKQIKPIKNELRELAARNQTLTTADKADLKAINKNIDQSSALKADIQKIMAKQHQEIRAMLSDEQLIKFDAMKARMGKKRSGEKGKQMERGDRKSHGKRA